MTARVRFGFTTMATLPPADFRGLVRDLEAGGFDDLWVCDSSLHARDVHVTLALAARESSRLRLGPNCTHPFTRHPAITVNALATLHELTGGRAALALGAGDRPVGELGYRPAAVATVREMIRVTRALARGETVDANGPIALAGARLAFPLPAPPLPIYVSASGDRMLALGGEVADGVLFFAGASVPGVEHALGRIRAGAAAAGRSLAGLDVGCTVAGSLRDDLTLARAECRPMAAWFPQTAPGYAALAGVPASATAAIRDAYEGGHFDAAPRAFAHVTDAMIDAFTIAGDAGVWVQRLKELIASGVRHINVFTLSHNPRAMARALVDQVLPALGGGPGPSSEPIAPAKPALGLPR
ncbi:MAG: LLM class flavin-dependent oxidoreductase [Candidatus Rokubacteria bacterium]|nr:LLM class flavin-dependent oxidoreductase [Candidatus Rokubacteria bacterium]